MPRRPRRTYPDLTAYFKGSGITQATFAQRIGKSQSYVSRLRTGELEPNLADALRISEEAGVPLESLIRRPAALSEL